MKRVELSEARRHRASLLEELEGGAEIVITRRGVAVARLVPAAEEGTDDGRLRLAVEALKRFRHGRRLGDMGLGDLIGDGRR